MAYKSSSVGFSTMNTDIRKSTSLESADSQAVIEHAFNGKPLNPAVANRVQERAEKVRDELRKTSLPISSAIPAMSKLVLDASADQSDYACRAGTLTKTVSGQALSEQVKAAQRSL